jgi:hypothetical protein
MRSTLWHPSRQKKLPFFSSTQACRKDTKDTRAEDGFLYPRLLSLRGR